MLINGVWTLSCDSKTSITEVNLLGSVSSGSSHGSCGPLGAKAASQTGNWPRWRGRAHMVVGWVVWKLQCWRGYGEKPRLGTVRQGQSLTQEANRGHGWRGAVETTGYWRCRDCGMSSKDRCRARLDPAEETSCMFWGMTELEGPKSYSRFSESDRESQMSDTEFFFFYTTQLLL